MLDKNAYRRDVLAPARARGNTPPADLLVRYALPRDGSVEGQLAEVVAYWRTLKQQKKAYAKLVDALLIEHADLERKGLLTRDGLNAETRRRVSDATARLTRRVGTLAETTTGISRAAFEYLVADTGGACSDARVRKVLADHGVRVVERSWDLPDTAPTPAYRTLSVGLGQLRLRLSAEAVVGMEAVRRGFLLRDGFRLTTASPVGPAGPLTGEMIATAIEQSAGRAMDEGKAVLDGVLSALAEAAREPGRLDELLLWEVMEILRPGAEAGLAAKVLAGWAADLGLVRAEAEELAMAMAARDARPVGVAGQVQEALRDGRLREAERLLPGLPAEAPPELRAEVEEKARQVTGWLAEATRERAAGRTEAAAELLDRAWRVAADDEAIGERLRALPPPPPGDVRVGLHRGRVTIAWTPAPARVGPVRYRVARSAGAPARGAAAGTVVGETDGNELLDADPPAAEELHYSVFAGRAEGIWSAPAVSRPVTLLPEVEDPSVVAGAREVAVSWRLPAGAAGAVVTRLVDGAGERRIPGVDRSGFVDVDVRPGRTYRYRVQASYERSDGTRVLSRGVVVTGLPEGPPEAVPDLSVDLSAAGGPPVATISWTAPSSGRVVIRTSDWPPPWPPGTVVAAADVERYGRQVPGAAVPGTGGRMALRTPVGGIVRGHFVAVSLGAGQALVGPSAVLVAVEPVRELDARRAGDTAVLSWIWPDGAQLAEVIWAPADLAGGGIADPDGWTAATTVECRRRAYEDDGCRLEIGPGAALVSVRTVARDGGGGARSRAVLATVPVREPEVRYRFRRPRWGRRGRSAVLELIADRRCRLPPLVVVHRAGGVLPLRPEQGEVIHEIPVHDLTPEAPLTLQIKIPAGPGPFRLACFVAPGTTDAVTLRRDPGRW